jgi:hypothetical protein
MRYLTMGMWCINIVMATLLLVLITLASAPVGLADIGMGR